MVTRETTELHNLNENACKRFEESELFSKRFGSFSKSDYEVLMFTIYLDSLDCPVRGYDISVALGLTESKVRNLRIKSQLMYPKEIDWVDELAASIEHGYYDKTQQLITVTFEDPSVQSMMKNIIEKNWGTVGRSLNVKQLVLPIESFLLLAAAAEQDEEEVLAKLNAALKIESKSLAVVEKKELKSRFMSGVPNVVSCISALLSIYSDGAPIIESLRKLITQV